MNNLEKAVIGVISIGVLLSSYFIYRANHKTQKQIPTIEASFGRVMQSFDRLNNTLSKTENQLGEIQRSMAYLQGLIDGSSSVRGYNKEQAPNSHHLTL